MSDWLQSKVDDLRCFFCVLSLLGEQSIIDLDLLDLALRQSMPDVERLVPASSFDNLAEIEYCWPVIGSPWLFLGVAAECDPMKPATKRAE
jgi:hypothetical protein